MNVLLHVCLAFEDPFCDADLPGIHGREEDHEETVTAQLPLVSGEQRDGHSLILPQLGNLRNFPLPQKIVISMIIS